MSIRSSTTSEGEVHLFDLPAVALQTPDPELLPGRQQIGVGAHAQNAADHRSGYYSSEAFDSEYPVRVKPEDLAAGALLQPGGEVRNGALELFNPLAAGRRDRHYRRSLQEGTGKRLTDLFQGHGQQVRLDQVGLG